LRPATAPAIGRLLRFLQLRLGKVPSSTGRLLHNLEHNAY
jgi:hypothetical protein